MTLEHNYVARRLMLRLQHQLGDDRYVVTLADARLRAPGGETYIPDVMVIPREIVPALGTEPGKLELYSAVLPFVVEVWSPSTADYDFETKFPVYRAHGHAEIWRIHPYERVATLWRRRADGGYDESRLIEGDLVPIALPGVQIPFAEMFR